MYDSTQKRNRVHHLVKTDLAEARRMAETIDEDWFRIQAFSKIAEVSDSESYKTYIDRIEQIARATEDAYNVSALAWPISVCIRRDDARRATSLTGVALQREGEISPGSSRVEALLRIWAAAHRLGGGTASRALEALERACHESNSWRGGRALYFVVLALAASDHPLANRVLDRFPPGRYRRQTERDFRAGKSIRPPEFH